MSSRNPDTIAETHALALSLNSAITHLGRRVRRIDDGQQIGRARLSALSVLVFGGPRTLSELAADEMVSAATMHHVIKGLTGLGFVTKRVDRTDARKTILATTRAGMRFMEKAREARLGFYRKKLAELSDEERRAVATFSRLSESWLS